MNKLDQQIRDALRMEDAELFEELTSQQSLPQMVLDSFRSRNWWLVCIVYLWTFLIFAGSIFCAVQFFTVDGMRHQLWWGAGFMLGMQMVAALKTWYWMELNRNAVTREVKRVELQIARLAQRMDSQRGSTGS